MIILFKKIFVFIVVRFLNICIIVSLKVVGFNVVLIWFLMVGSEEVLFLFLFDMWVWIV